MGEWVETTIGEIAEVYDGPHATPKKTESGPWFLSISSLNGGRLDLAESAHLSEEDFIKWTRRVIPQEGDVLFSYETRLGEAALMPGGIRACLGRRMGLLRPKIDHVEPRFLLYAYLSPAFQNVIQERKVHGATVDRIPLAELPGWPICIPSLDKQQAIATVLGALDDKIAVNERIAEATRSLGMAQFRAAVDMSSTEHDVASVSAVLVRGVTPRYSDEPDALTVLNQKCIRGGRVSLGPARRTLGGRVPNNKLLQHGDVLVNSTGVGTLGRVARWTGEEKCTVDSHVTIVRFDETKVDLVCAGFAMLAAQAEIERLGEGSTGQTELSRAKLGDFRITLPNSSSCRLLSPKLQALEARGDAALRENQTLAQLRDTLLPKLMSGELRVRDAEKMVEDAT